AGNYFSRAILWHVSDQTKSSPVIAVVGPTASGKSTLAIELALALNGEIINCDSVQVYRDIEIATAKVPASEQKGVPHHLIGFVPPEVNYTAVEWAAQAILKIHEIESRGRVVFLVGGTGFYLGALRRPFFVSPKMDAVLRQRINSMREKRGAEYLHRVLSRLDRAGAKQLHARDWPRVQRALEVYLQTGRSIFDQREQRPEPHESSHRLRIVALNPPRNELYERINRRTEEHFEAGLVNEVKALLERGVPAESNALGAHGYRRVVEYLQGKRTLESALEQTKLDVRHYAKRQMTWFRREEGVQWFQGFGDRADTIRDVCEALAPTFGLK
ncbi:MAG TPA: tRNA (adenosine(37)-N6)-dimethylallyltransferase MiaA, partial [Pyrinomonadaceae bacterium]